MKELIKVRKSWLLHPATKIEQSKKIKQRFQEENEKNWNKYTGNINRQDLEEIEEIEEMGDEK